MNIQQRILLGPLVAIVLLIVFGGVAYRAIATQTDALQDIKETRFEQYRTSTEMSERLSHVHVQLFGLVTWFSAYDQATQNRLVAETPQKMDKLLADFSTWQGSPRLTDAEKQKLTDIGTLLKRYRKEMDAAINMVQIDLTSALGDMKAVASHFAALEKAFGEMNDLERHLADSTYADARDQAQAAVSFNIVVLLLAIAIAGVIGLLTARHLLRQLGGEPALAVEVASRIAEGDLSVQVPPAPTGSLIAAISTMRESLGHTISRMAQHALELSSAAEQVATASSQVARRSSEQNEAASSMAAAIQQMSVSITTVSDSAREASDMSTHSGTTANEGASIVNSAAQEMQNIAGSVNEVSEVIGDLGQHAATISGVVTVIKDVADQTNLLALNAAIEAARAGEQGRGFAVVADEVRKLAERTTSSTQEINTMITAIQAASSAAMTSMDAAAKRVALGVELANDAGSAIGRIRDEAHEVLSSVVDISSSLREQGTVTQDIANHVERIATMSDENNTVAGESAAAAAQLQALAHTMRDEVSRFRLA